MILPKEILAYISDYVEEPSMKLLNKCVYEEIEGTERNEMWFLKYMKLLEYFTKKYDNVFLEKNKSFNFNWKKEFIIFYKNEKNITETNLFNFFGSESMIYFNNCAELKEIPKEIFFLKYCLNNNINDLKFIKKLALPNNEIKNICLEIECLDLNFLNLRRNYIEEIPEHISKLKNLTNLMLDNNMIEIFPWQLCELTNLKELDISYNKIKIIPEQICNLSNLEILDLSENEIMEIPKQIKYLKKLKELRLEKNNITCLIPEIFELENLEIMDLCKNKIKDIPDNFNYLKKLNKLCLSSNKIEEIPKSIINILKNIKRINNGGMCCFKYNNIKSMPKEIYDIYVNSWNFSFKNDEEDERKTKYKKIECDYQEININMEDSLIKDQIEFFHHLLKIEL